MIEHYLELWEEMKENIQFVLTNFKDLTLNPEFRIRVWLSQKRRYFGWG